MLLLNQGSIDDGMNLSMQSSANLLHSIRLCIGECEQHLRTGVAKVFTFKVRENTLVPSKRLWSITYTQVVQGIALVQCGYVSGSWWRCVGGACQEGGEEKMKFCSA